jgi:hypothetical protein
MQEQIKSNNNLPAKEDLQNKKPNKYFEKEKLLKTIQERANYQGNYSELFLERLNNPIFFEKTVDMLYNYQLNIEYTGAGKQDRNGNLKKIPKKTWVRTIKKFRLSREQIFEILKNRIKETFGQTQIDFRSNKSNSGGVGGTVGFFHPEFLNQYKPMTVLQMNITEAHEKGHIIRNMQPVKNSFTNNLYSAFNFEELKKIIKNPEVIKIYREVVYKDLVDDYKSIGLSDEEINTKIVNSELEYNRNPMEIIERMAQLRNYFGMKFGEEFTKEHLDYVRENYTKDTGFYLQIQPFLNAITTQTEKRFLQLINELPI